MTDLARRKSLTFAQAEGAEPLPQQLALKEVSQELRALLWSIIYTSMKKFRGGGGYSGPITIRGAWRNILLARHVTVEHRMTDEFDDEFAVAAGGVKQLIAHGSYIDVLGFLQWLLRRTDCPITPSAIQEALLRSRAAYRVMDDSQTIVPIASAEEAEALDRAFADLAAVEFHGARTHLRLAAQHLTAGKCADSIRESIHAVESVARSIEPTGSLSGALQKIENRHSIHPSLRKGFVAIYGFTSDEKGIRHPLLEKNAAAVDETDALFMIGASAAFVSYLIGKTRVAEK